MIFFFNLIFFVWAAVLFSESNTSERKTFAYTILIIWNDHIDFLVFLTIWVWYLFIPDLFIFSSKTGIFELDWKIKSYKFIKQNYAVRVNGCITNSFIFKIFSKHKIVKQNPMSAMYSKGLNCIPGSLYFEESNAFYLLLLTWPYKLWNISAGSKTH